MTLNKTDSLTVIFYDLMQPLPIDPVSASLKVINLFIFQLLVDNALLDFLEKRQIGS